ncbi:hypothetical protein CBR_g4638 [Chara braunii]|uniref:Uncharacterized protein n=1 Tax=Chara braunii TaxID=69332 RepID=A0A388KIE4_CHABU|nr:hypothetical protein CBR_g4638 [Chara braunii]|eukprot:GBG69809.1 hypothetical protein CBR_g4638 [Chara braunii]
MQAGRRVNTLEDIISRINSKHEADVAREKAVQEGNDGKKREHEEKERRLREKREREEFQSSIRQELSSKLDAVREVVSGKKASDAEEIAKLRAQVEMLCCRKEPVVTKDSVVDEVRKLKARVDDLQRARDAVSTSATIRQTCDDAKELTRFRKEQLDVKAATDKRLATLEAVIVALQKQCEVAEADAEAWKNGALRPGNKRGAMAIGQTLATEARVRSRVTPAVTPGATGRVNPQIKAMVERHQQEVDLLKEMRLREVNARKESEEEIERLRNSLAKLDSAKKRGGTNLKSKLD